MPLISILTPVYNREQYIGAAIESVQQQSVQDWEMLIVDDASIDKTVAVVKRYQADDQRIKLIEKPNNSGISATRNCGLQEVQGKYIAMLDSDDVCFPDRFEKQLSFLKTHPKVGVVGAWAQHIGRSNRQFTPQATDEVLRARTLYRCPFVHSSTMVRTAIIEQHQLRYREDYPAANDYNFWVKIAPYTKFYNLQEYLVWYRTHTQNISVTHRSDQDNYRMHTSRLAFQNLLNWNISEAQHQPFFELLAYEKLNVHQLPFLEETAVEFLAKVKQQPAIQLDYLRPIVYTKFMNAFQQNHIEAKEKFSFILRQQAWRYLPIRKYLGTYSRLLMKELLRTSRHQLNRGSG